MQSLDDQLQDDDFQSIMGTAELLYQDLENINSVCLTNFEEIMNYTQGRDAVVISLCRTSVYLEKKWDRKIQQYMEKSLSSGSDYPVPLLRLLKEFAKLLCLCVSEKQMDNRRANGVTKLQSQIFENVKTMIDEENIEVYLKSVLMS